MNTTSWTLESVWNAGLTREDRPLVKRDYAWASEIGQPLVDRFLKMNATPYTNPANDRAKRKMEAGLWVESFVRIALDRAGLITNVQEEVWTDFGPIKVKGKLDFLAGGRVDIDKARKAIMGMGLPPSIEQGSLKIAEALHEKHGHDMLREIVLEIKSVGSYKMDAFEREEKPKPVFGHKMQCAHYIFGLNKAEGHVVYICREDLRMKEFSVWNTGELMREYVDDLNSLSGYLEAGERPPLERVLLFEDGKFSKNLGVEYSPYLTLLYGYETPRNYSEAIAPKATRWNRVIKRYQEGAKITDKNKEVREEIERAGYDFEQIVKIAHVVEEEEEN